MADCAGVSQFEFFVQRVRAVDRPMLAARAADGHREVATMFLGMPRQPLLEIARNVINHFADRIKRLQVLNHCRVATVEGFQLGIIVRIGKTARIKDEVGIQRNTVFESEGLKQHHQRRVLDRESLSPSA